MIKWNAEDADFPVADTAVCSTYRTHGIDVTVLLSELPDDEHNAWANKVFEYVCAVSAGDVQLLDQDDNVVRSRKATAAA